MWTADYILLLFSRVIQGSLPAQLGLWFFNTLNTQEIKFWDRMDFNSLTLRVYYVCIALLSIKMLLMSLLTARLRFKKKVFISPEDKVLVKNSQVHSNNPEIERVRRAHRNDFENIPVFISLGCLYSMTDANPLIAGLLYVVYTLSRFAHTYVYAIKVTPQPARFLCFAIGYVINLYMAGAVIYHTGIV